MDTSRELAPDQVNRDPFQSEGDFSIALFLFTIFWCAIVTLLDYNIVPPIINQARSTMFQTTPARILSSKESSHVSSGKRRSKTHGVEFNYTYAVNGTNYMGHLYTFDTSKSSDRQWVVDALRDFPAGSDRTCYYDPENPAMAVLKPGISGGDLTRLMFMMPFNLIAVGLIGLNVNALRQRRYPDLLAPRVRDPRRNRESYSMNSTGPGTTFLLVLLITTFIGIFIVVLPFGFHPKLSIVGTIWSIALAISIAAATNVFLKTRAGKYDFVIDRDSQSVTIPAMHKRNQPFPIPLSDVASVDTEEIEIAGSRGRKNHRWHVNLNTRAGQKIHLYTTYTPAEALRVADTLSTKIMGR